MLWCLFECLSSCPPIKVATSHMWLFKLNFEIIKIKLKTQFLNSISDHKPYVPSGYHIGQAGLGHFHHSESSTG